MTKPSLALTFLVSMAAFSTGYAEATALELPDGISAHAIKTNFDGSTTFVRPKVLVADYFIGITPHSGVGFCSIFGMKLVVSTEDYWQRPYPPAVLDDKGSFSGYGSRLKNPLGCKPLSWNCFNAYLAADELTCKK